MIAPLTRIVMREHDLTGCIAALNHALRGPAEVKALLRHERDMLGRLKAQIVTDGLLAQAGAALPSHSSF